MLASLGATATSGGSGIPVLPLNPDPVRRREPSPDGIQLAQAIEEARRDSLKLEERRTTILEKVEKLEKKKAKKQQKQLQPQQSEETSPTSTSKMDEARMEEFEARAAESLVEQMENRPPREPPVVYRGNCAISFKNEHLDAVD